MNSIIEDDDDGLTPEIRSRLQEEIVEHLKRSGTFDNIRVDILDDIYNDPYYKEEIVVKFIAECEKFCDQADLSQTRNTLRTKLSDKFEHSYSASKRRVSSHIENILDRKRHEIESKFSHHAENFLSQFLSTTSPSPKVKHESKVVENERDDKDVHFSMDDTVAIKVQLETEYNLDDLDHISPEPILPDASNLPQIPRVPEEQYNFAILDLNSIPEPPDSPPSSPPLTQPPLPPMTPDERVESENTQADSDMDIESIEDIERPSYSPLGASQEQEDKPNRDRAHDNDLSLSFSSVSSVNTADLSDFEESIKLSDDEADIVGKPKNSKVPIGVIQDIVELKNKEPCDTGESDCGESGAASSEGRRLSRTRRSNPRYNNENFIA